MPDTPMTQPADESALSTVPTTRVSDGVVTWFYGPMDCGKSTLALQIDHNHSRQGRSGVLLTRFDRSSEGRISSRMGFDRPAHDVADEDHLGDFIRQRISDGHHVDYVIVDEAQFFTDLQVEQLCELADTVPLDVYAFGLATDFRGRLFPGSARWFELADQVAPLQVQALCWCGRAGRFNARVVDGEIARTGETVVVADVRGVALDAPQVHYQVLCRIHHRSGALGPVRRP